MLLENESCTRLSRRRSKRREFRPAPQIKLKNSPAQIVGYIPKRHGFEFCCNNDAEQFIAQMEFSEIDTPEETALKY